MTAREDCMMLFVMRWADAMQGQYVEEAAKEDWEG